jgi:hypothetical protein
MPYALCPMPYALCPREHLVLLRKAIHINTSTFDAALDFQLDLAIFNRSIFGPLVGQNSTLERRKMQLLGVTILFYLASIWEYYLISGVNSEGWFLRSFFLISSQGYAILFVFSILAFSKSIALPSRGSGLIKILSAYSFPLYLLDSTVVKYVLWAFYKFICPVHPLLKLGFLLTGNLLVCWAIIYLWQKVLPKNYSQYILGI